MNKEVDLLNIIYIMAHSPEHSKYTVSDIFKLIIPPISLDQYMVYHKENKVIGFATWAFLSDDMLAKKYANPQFRLQGNDWNSGSNYWLANVVAPFGSVRQFYRAYRERTATLNTSRVHFKRFNRKAPRSVAV